MSNPDEHDGAAYQVPNAGSAAPKQAGAPLARSPAAIFVAHGMGQQIPFQTMEAVAEGLLQQGGRRSGSAQVAKTVMVGGERLQRIELDVALKNGTTREVHIYEGYWAPLTEGQVTLRDVTGFLFRSAFAGIQLGLSDFRRWMFGSYVQFPAPVRAVLYLLLALGVVVTLALLNGVIVTIAAARAPMQSPPGWLGPALFQDVTTILNTLICALVPFAVVLGWATWRRRSRKSGKRASLGPISVATFIFALWSIMAAAVLVAGAIAFHAGLPATDPSSLFGSRLTRPIEAFDNGFDTVTTGILVFVGIAGLLLFTGKMVRELRVAFGQNTSTRMLTLRVLGGFILLFGGLAVLAAFVWTLRLRGSTAAWRSGIAWPLVVGVAAIVRSFLIEYAGDLAAYLQPQTLDRFYALRQKIKDVVARIARAVYSDPQYEDIIVVGHSLGSVVVYDVLNRLILDRQLAVAGAPEIVGRTKLLLTFGSPLDKTAFIFGIQGTGGEAREALAASVQPLITDQLVRPKWINIWSPWDIISGHLDYYDLPDDSNRNAVDNIKDERATTLLAAHVEYWTNPAIFEQILAHLG